MLNHLRLKHNTRIEHENTQQKQPSMAEFVRSPRSRHLSGTKTEEITRAIVNMVVQDYMPLKWWKTYSSKYPRLSVLARRYLAVPGTSVPSASERIFSTAGLILTKLGNRLSPSCVDKIIFLNKNKLAEWGSSKCVPFSCLFVNVCWDASINNWIYHCTVCTSNEYIALSKLNFICTFGLISVAQSEGTFVTYLRFDVGGLVSDMLLLSTVFIKTFTQINLKPHEFILKPWIKFHAWRWAPCIVHKCGKRPLIRVTGYSIGKSTD